MGANAIIELGGEIKKPHRTIPISLLISIPLVAVIYITMSFVAVGVTGWEACADKSLIESARAFLSPASLNFFIIGGAILAIATTLNATFMWGTKSLMIVGKDGLLPGVLTRVNPRFGTPIYMLTLIWALSVIAVISGIPIKSFAIYASIGGLVIFVPVMIASVMLKTKDAGRVEGEPSSRCPNGLLVACVVMGILFFAVAIAALFMELFNSDRFMFWFFFVLVATGVAYYLIMKRRARGEKGADWTRRSSGNDRAPRRTAPSIPYSAGRRPGRIPRIYGGGIAELTWISHIASCGRARKRRSMT